MTYLPHGATRRIGMGDDGESTFATVLAAFLPKINEIQAAGDAAAQAQVDKIVQQATGAPPKSPATTTVSGSTSASSVTAADYKLVAGGLVAKPINFPALAAAKDLQMQCNRIAKAKGFGTITVDGDIGPGTISLLNKGAVVGGFPPTSTVPEVITHVGSTTANVRALADKIGAPPPTSTEVVRAASAGSIVVTSTNGGEQFFKPPGASAGIVDTIKSLPDTTKIIGLGAGVLGAVFVIKKLRGRRGGTSLALPAAGATSNPARRRRHRKRRR
jgi:hypothetical protein